MMRRWLAQGVERLAMAVDDAVPEAVLRTYLQKHLRTAKPSTQHEQILYNAASSFASAFLDSLPPASDGNGPLRTLLPSSAMCHAWLEEHKGERIVRWKGVQRGTSAYMLALFVDDDAARDEVASWMQTLLRHVEVRRKLALQILPEGDADPARIEQSQTAYMFSRAALRWEDARFLNAALKLNDWSFPAFRRGPRSEAGFWYVLALAATEHALEQMTC